MCGMLTRWEPGQMQSDNRQRRRAGAGERLIICKFHFTVERLVAKRYGIKISRKKNKFALCECKSASATSHSGMESKYEKDLFMYRSLE